MSHQISISQELDADTISAGALAYIGQRAKNSYYHFVMSKFRECDMTQAKLARKIGKNPAQMNRILASPGNWTIETIAVLLAGICSEEVTPSSTPFAGRRPRNGRTHDMTKDDAPKPLPSGPVSSGEGANLVELRLENVQ